MTKDEARAVLLRAFAAGSIPPEWLVLLKVTKPPWWKFWSR
jgi:hypothetical protein